MLFFFLHLQLDADGLQPVSTALVNIYGCFFLLLLLLFERCESTASMASVESQIYLFKRKFIPPIGGKLRGVGGRRL